MTETTLLILVLLVRGCVCRLWWEKRRFKRLNQLDIEQFPSYGHKIRAIALDVLLLGAGLGLLGSAAIGYLAEYAQPLVAGVFLLLIIWLFEAQRTRSRKEFRPLQTSQSPRTS